MTVNDTALMTSYVISSYDLSNYTEGLTDGYIAAGHFQEIDVASSESSLPSLALGSVG